MAGGLHGTVSTWRPDGTVRFRRDGCGGKIALLPATCRRGAHGLGMVGFRACVHGGLMYIACEGCDGVADRDQVWVLTMDDQSAERAELDDRPYPDLLAAGGFERQVAR